MYICLPSLSPKKYKNSDLFDQTVRNNKMSLRKSRVLSETCSSQIEYNVSFDFLRYSSVIN